MAAITRRALLALLLVLLSRVAICAAVEGGVPAPSELEGAWQESLSGSLLHFESDRVIAYAESSLTVRAVERHEPGRLILRRKGLLEVWEIATEQGTLWVTADGKKSAFKRLGSIPKEVQIVAAPISEPRKLSEDPIRAIQSEISARQAKGNAVRQDRSRWPEMAAVDAENTQYLKGLIQEIGWIDVDRFGHVAARDAFLLVQHSGDLGLMIAAMPFIEKDFKHTDGSQSFALLFDRLQLALGHKQRYGTQIGMDKEGKPFVYPLEDPARVNDLLKELRLPPLSEYLAEASKLMFEGKEIRLLPSE